MQSLCWDLRDYCCLEACVAVLSPSIKARGCFEHWTETLLERTKAISVSLSLAISELPAPRVSKSGHLFNFCAADL